MIKNKDELIKELLYISAKLEASFKNNDESTEIIKRNYAETLQTINRILNNKKTNDKHKSLIIMTIVASVAGILEDIAEISNKELEKTLN